MKFGSDLPYNKAIKKSKGGNQSTAMHRPPGAMMPSRGRPMRWKFKVPKFSHIINQLTTKNFM